MWINTAEGMRLVAEITRHIVNVIAREELELFDELIEDYFRNPLPPDHSRPRHDDPLAFGVEETLVPVTPAAAAMVTRVVSEMSQAIHVSEGEDSDAVRRRIGTLFHPEKRASEIQQATGDRLDQALSSGRSQALLFGMSPAQADRMAAELAGLLAGAGEPLLRESAVAAEAEPGAEFRRYANVCLTRPEDSSVVPGTFDLGRNRTYRLRFDIGPLSSDSVVENAAEEPIPPLPESEEGHWLEVIVVSDDFRLPRPRHWLFLPNEGSSWVCDCDRASRHVCTSQEREQYLFVEVWTPVGEVATSARLRIGLYWNKNLLQSQLIEAAVREVEGPGEGYRSRIDYTLSGKLAGIGKLPSRTLNILTNRNADGTHKLVINGAEDEVLDFNLTEGQMAGAIGGIRQALRDIHYEEYGGHLGGRRERRNLYNTKNAKARDAFLEDLKRLAPFGRRLWTLLLADRPQLRRKLKRDLLREPASIQVSRTGGSEFVFPWGLVYDIPLESDLSKHKLCGLLKNWDQVIRTLGEGVQACPHEGEHAKNIICPFGFWGFKHTIEQPPSMPEDRNLPLVILKPRGKPLEIVIGRSADLNMTLTDAHVESLKARFAIAGLKDCDSLPKLIQALVEPALGVLYFYCHGRRETIRGTDHSVPYIEVGSGERVFPDDLVTWDDADWSEDHWRETSPLVFINGCHTAELEPESIVNFVDAFAGVYAAGVIGTEIALHQQIANEAAEIFFEGFEENHPVGDALRMMRNRLLYKGNLLGLAYTAYCSTDLRLADV